MCMHVKDEAVNPKVLKNGFVLGYKILINNDRNVSPCEYFKYVLGENISDRISKERFEYEKYGIVKGFHIFRNLKSAKIWLDMNEKIIKVYYKPEDVVAYGDTFYGLTKLPTVVTMKLTIKSFDGIKYGIK